MPRRAYRNLAVSPDRVGWCLLPAWYRRLRLVRTRTLQLRNGNRGPCGFSAVRNATYEYPWLACRSTFLVPDPPDRARLNSLGFFRGLRAKGSNRTSTHTPVLFPPLLDLTPNDRPDAAFGLGKFVSPAAGRALAYKEGSGARFHCPSCQAGCPPARRRPDLPPPRVAVRADSDRRGRPLAGP